MTTPLPLGLNVTLYPAHATWGALREFVKMADALKIPDDVDLRCVYDSHDELEGMAFGPEDGAGE